MSIFAQIQNGVVVALFSCPQDPELIPDVEEIDEEDQRYIEFNAPKSPEVITDPIDKLKAFLAENPDVAKILGV